MTTNISGNKAVAGGPSSRLGDLGIVLPAPPTPLGAYVESSDAGNLLFLSGMLPVVDHKLTISGRLGENLSVKQGQEAARIASLNALAAAKQHLGTLDRLKKLVKLTVLIATTEQFADHAPVADGASNLLVHGAWADGSGWKGVYDILVKDGYNVSIVQEPETSFKEDVAATKRVLAQQDGPCILVAHSYGGAVITEAGTDSSVAGLVYIAAHMPDAGENEADDGKRFPSDLSKSGAIKKTADGFTYLDPAQFHEYFAADLPAEQAAFMARSQVLNFADNFKAVITTAAWRSKPSWALVAAADRTINPDLERWYA